MFTDTFHGKFSGHDHDDEAAHKPMMREHLPDHFNWPDSGKDGADGEVGFDGEGGDASMLEIWPREWTA